MRHELNIDNLVERDGPWGDLTFADDYMAVTDGVQRCIEIMGEGWKDYAGWSDDPFDVANHITATLDEAIRLLRTYRDAFEAAVPPQLSLDHVNERLTDTLKERPLTHADLVTAVSNMAAANQRRAKFKHPEDIIHILVTAAFAPPTKENA